MVKMRAFVALKRYILKHELQAAKLLLLSQYLPFDKTRKLIPLMYVSLMLFSIFSAMTKSSAFDVVLSQQKAVVSTTVDARNSNTTEHQANTAKIQTSIPSDWMFFSMSTDQDASLFYSPKSVHTSASKTELMIKWIYVQKRGPSYSNSQKILNRGLGEYNYTLSYGIGIFTFDCARRIGTETKEIYFDSKGNVLFTYVPAPLVSSYFAPDTIYGYLLNIVCPK